MRTVLLRASQSAWLQERAVRYGFVRRAVDRFMPGETLDDALAAAGVLRTQRIATVLTQLGENVTSVEEAEAVTQHYLGVLRRVRELGLDAQISVKPTQLGLDLSFDLCCTLTDRLVRRAGDLASMVWIDMESSAYVDRTLELFRRLRRDHSNVGVCLQSYLRRTAADLEALLPLGPAIRLAKGAYKEAPGVAFPRKRDVDGNYLALARRLLGEEARRAGATIAIATHDRRIIRQLEQLVTDQIPKETYEYEMLYGIQREEQRRLARSGHRMRVLISYGHDWFPWFMRRLAERPANVLFIAKQLVAR